MPAGTRAVLKKVLDRMAMRAELVKHRADKADMAARLRAVEATAVNPPPRPRPPRRPLQRTVVIRCDSSFGMQDLPLCNSKMNVAGTDLFP